MGELAFKPSEVVTKEQTILITKTSFYPSFLEYLWKYGVPFNAGAHSIASGIVDLYIIPENMVLFVTNAHLYQYNTQAQGGAGLQTIAISTMSHLTPFIEVFINGDTNTNHSGLIAFNPPILVENDKIVLDNQQNHSFASARIYGFLLLRSDYMLYLSKFI